MTRSAPPCSRRGTWSGPRTTGPQGCGTIESWLTASRRRLPAAGVRPVEAVVLVAGNTVPAVIAYHSLLRLGATAVLLDRRCGAADVSHALEAAPGLARVLIPSGDRDRLLNGR